MKCYPDSSFTVQLLLQDFVTCDQRQAKLASRAGLKVKLIGADN
jgi:hypothetical protein